MSFKTCWIFAIVPMFFGSQALAQDSEVTIQINQPYVSKTLGELRLPFMWQTEEIESQKRLIVMETQTVHPALLTIDLIDTPKGIDETLVAQSIAGSIAESLGTTAEVKSEQIKTECGKSKCPSMTVFRSDMTGTEQSIPRRCAIEIIPTNGKSLVFTICAFAAQLYSPDLPEILNQVFAGMK